MSEKIEVVIACLKELGVKPSLGTFENRLVIQKLVYLLQKLEVPTGFQYGLYVHGPYSPDLTKCLYAHQKELETLQTRHVLTAKEAGAVNQLKEINLKPEFLEVMSTYLCLSIDLHEKEDDAIRRLKELKPFFSEGDVAVGVSKAKQLLFKPTKEDLEWLKKENAAWSAVSDESLSRSEEAMRKVG